MNGDTGDNPASTPPGATTSPAAAAPVRRSARTRKPNSRFADDEVDSCFKKIVSGLASPESNTTPAHSPGRPRKAIGRRKDSRSEDKSEEVEERSERGKKDSKDDERNEEVEERYDRGRKLSEECEEKSERKRKERSDELEERSEQGKKASQNEERSEDLEERGERRKENRSEDVEEKREKRRRKDSQSEESLERKEKLTPLEEKPASHSLPNGLEVGREGVEECTRVTRSGRREEEPRRKPRKRGKGKEEEQDKQETTADTPTEPAPSGEPKSQDSASRRTTDKTGSQEGSECIQGASHTPTEPSPGVHEGGNKNTTQNSDGEGAKRPTRGVRVSPVRSSSKESDGVTEMSSRLVERDMDSHRVIEQPTNPLQDKDRREENTQQDEEVKEGVEAGHITSSSESTVTSMTNGEAGSDSSSTTQPQEAITTTTTTTSTPTTTAVTTTATTVITAATTTITVTTTATTITTAITIPSTTAITRSRQPPAGPVPPPVPSEAPTDPRLHRGMHASTGVLGGGRVQPQVQGTVNIGAIPTPSSPQLPPDTGAGGKGGVVPAQGSRRSSRWSARETLVSTIPALEVKSMKVMCENIPLPPDFSASPKHGKQAEEALRKMGGKRERGEKEENTTGTQRLEEEKKEEDVSSCSPQSKRRKEGDGGRKEKVEESKEEETKRKRLTDAKEEEDKRKRRKVEEAEDKEHDTPKAHKETPLLPPPVPTPVPAPLPASAPPLSPLAKRPMISGPQNSPKNRRESIPSPRVERDGPKERDSPRRNRESLRSRNITSVQEKDTLRDTKDSKGGKGEKESLNSLQGEADSGKGEEPVKEECEVDSGKGRVMPECGKNSNKTKEDCAKGERELLKGKDPVKSKEDTDKSKEDVVKSEKEAVKSKDTPAKSIKGEKEAIKSDKDTVKSSKSEKDASKSKEEPAKSAKSERETVKSREDPGKSVKSDREAVKSEKDTGTSEKGNQDTTTTNIPDPSTTELPTDDQTLPGLFLPTQEADIGAGAGMGVFLGLSSTSSTAIPFLEDTPSTTSSECEIPGLSILASGSSSDNTPQRTPPKKEQSHRSWFTIGGSRRSQASGRAETQSNGNGGDGKEERKKVEEIKVDEKKEVEEEKEEEEATETPMEVKEETKAEEDEEQKRKEAEEKDARNRAVVEERLKSFTHLQENVYIGERKRSKRNKEVRRMVCDCSLTKEEMERGEVGCGDDCLNRLLMIECGSRCPLGDHCINKRFLNRQYGDAEVFNTDEKGCGLRARSDMPPGTFIMEYVGEVFDTREFKRRRKEYARDMRDHFYFMALKSDQLIDATNMGNISRFINHSCDPNAETQKWTVNGDLRIGFFSKRYIEAGEEINFDYRLERYGREPQRCYCGAANCRGWLGEAPDEQTKEEKDEARRKEERDRRKREERRAFFEDIDLEEEIEKLNSHKLRNRQDTLNLSRLMVRAEDFTSRDMLLHLLRTGEPACRRLFLDYHGLKVLWSWMVDLGLSHQHTTLKVEILKTLEVLPITNKTQLTDSRVLSLVERWSGQGGYTPSSTTSTSLSPPPPPPPKADEASLPPPAPNLASEPDPNKKSSDTSEESDSETDPKIAIEASSADDSSLDSEVDNPKASAEEESSDSNDAKDTTAAASAIGSSEDKLRVERLSDEEKEVQELLELHNTMVALAKKLLDAWKNLKEFFRIPKKERIEMMKEHEREVDRGYKEYLDQASESDRDSERDKDRRDKDRDRYNRRDHHYDRRRRSPDRDKERYPRGRGGVREERSSDSPKMSKEQRRQLFELKVQQQEEEAKQRKMQEEMWTMHVDRCRLLGHDPYLTPIFDPTYQYFWDPVAANWQPYTGSDPNLPVPAGYGLTKGEGDGSPLTLVVPGAQNCRSHLAGAGDPPGLGQGGPNDPLNPANIPLPGEVPTMLPGSPTQGHEGTPPHGAKLLSIPLPGEATAGLEGVAATPLDGADTPGAITIHLPPRWRLARDATSHVYFYHVKTRVSQWEPPALLNSGLGSDSSSDSSSDSDSDSSSTSDSEDFSSEEEEEEEVVETVARSDVSDEKMIRRPKGTKRRRSEALVQERVISPIMEIDKEAARRERREAKERAREEARQERQEERNTRGQKEEQSQPQTQPQPQQQQQLQQQQQQSEGGEGVAAVTVTAVSVPVEKERDRERDRERERERRAERHEARAKREKSKERAASAIADNSDAARKIKDTFRSKMATFIVSVLNPYRRGDCREGKITCTEDFKYLARKLTHFVMVKELKQLHSIEALECSDSVKHKTRDFVRKYMSKYGSVFKRDPNDTKEY